MKILRIDILSEKCLISDTKLLVDVAIFFKNHDYFQWLYCYEIKND